MNVFKPDTVVSLYKSQCDTQRHPHTCANHNNDNHRPEMDFLIPTVRGWICPFCDYTQNWAHPTMMKAK